MLEAATVSRGTFDDLLLSSLNRKSYHQHTEQNRKQQQLHPLQRNLTHLPTPVLLPTGPCGGTLGD